LSSASSISKEEIVSNVFSQLQTSILHNLHTIFCNELYMSFKIPENNYGAFSYFVTRRATIFITSDDVNLVNKNYLPYKQSKGKHGAAHGLVLGHRPDRRSRHILHCHQFVMVATLPIVALVVAMVGRREQEARLCAPARWRSPRH
jgi:hypothetical protein